MENIKGLVAPFEAEIQRDVKGTCRITVPAGVAALFRNSPIVIVTIEENKEAKA